MPSKSKKSKKPKKMKKKPKAKSGSKFIPSTRQAKVPKSLTFQNQTFARWTVTPSNSKTVVSQDVRLSARVYFCRAFRYQQPSKKSSESKSVSVAPAALISPEYFDHLCRNVLGDDCKPPEKIRQKVQVQVQVQVEPESKKESDEESEEDTETETETATFVEEDYILLLKWPLNLFDYSRSGLKVELVDEIALPQTSGSLRPDQVVQANHGQRPTQLVSPDFTWLRNCSICENSRAVLWRWYQANTGVYLYYLQTPGARIPCISSEPFQLENDKDALRTDLLQTFLQKMETDLGIHCVSLHAEFGVIALYSRSSAPYSKKGKRAKKAKEPKLINVRAKKEWEKLLEQISSSDVLTPYYMVTDVWTRAWEDLIKCQHWKDLDQAAKIEVADEPSSSLHGLSQQQTDSAMLFHIQDSSGNYLTANRTYRDHWKIRPSEPDSPNSVKCVLQPDAEKASLWRLTGRRTSSKADGWTGEHQQGVRRAELVRKSARSACDGSPHVRGTGFQIKLPWPVLQSDKQKQSLRSSSVDQDNSVRTVVMAFEGSNFVVSN